MVSNCGAKGRWGVVAAVGLASIALSALAEPKPKAPKNYPHSQSQKPAPPQPKQAAQPASVAAFTRPPAKPNDQPCPLQGKAYQGNTNCRQTLAAEYAARYTGWLVFVGFIQALLLLGQVVALILTIRQTRSAVKAAQKSAEAAQNTTKLALAQVRPWLKAEIIDHGDLMRSGGDLRMDFTVRVTNTGNIPATNIWIQPKMFCGGRIVIFKPPEPHPGTSGKGIGFSLFPKDPLETVVHGILNKNRIEDAVKNATMMHRITVGVSITAYYDFPGGTGLTSKSYEVISGHMMEQVDLKEIPISKDALSLLASVLNDQAT